MRAACLLLMLVALAGCGTPSAPTTPRERLARVETTTPTLESLSIRVELTATVEPLYKVDVCARVNGVVAEFFPADLDIGHCVTAGQPILRLDVPVGICDRRNAPERGIVGAGVGKPSNAPHWVRLACHTT